MLNFPWFIFLFSILIWILLIVYLYFLNKYNHSIKKIMVLCKDQSLEFLTKDYVLVKSLLDSPDLIISFLNDFLLIKKLISLNIPIISISSFNENEIEEIVKMAKYYRSTLIINTNLENIKKDLQKVKNGHIIRIYQ